MKNIVWLSLKEDIPARGYWDQRLLEEIFEGQNHIETNLVPNLDNLIVVIPGAYHGDKIHEINTQLQRVMECTVIITSDEENNFPLDKLEHGSMRLFANYYNSKYKNEINWLPIGPANVFATDKIKKINNFVFSGQVTHEAREEYVKELRKRNDGQLIETDGFAKGLEPKEYFKLISTAKTVPSPAGNISPDAFRTYEAIHAGAVPVPTDPEFYNAVFGSVPFPVIDKYEQVNGYIDDTLKRYPEINNETQAWWIRYKVNLKKKLLDPEQHEIAVMIPCSPIKSHPQIDVIDHTIKTVVHHLPDAPIYVTFDGVRSEQEDRRDNYEEFKRRFLWECYNNELYKNVIPIIFKEHHHQVRMAREILPEIDAKNVLYVEQDTPLTPDESIDWKKCLKIIDKGEANLVRFHFETFVPEEHRHLMIGEVEDGFLRTAQWSQRPHIISVPYLDKILNLYFTEDATCFIEDKMHGIVQNDVDKYGMRGWMIHRLWIYHPEGSIKRSYHLDGREGEEKYDDTQIW